MLYRLPLVFALIFILIIMSPFLIVGIIIESLQTLTSK